MVSPGLSTFSMTALSQMSLFISCLRFVSLFTTYTLVYLEKPYFPVCQRPLTDIRKRMPTAVFHCPH